jgi:hypothetical protein
MTDTDDELMASDESIWLVGGMFGRLVKSSKAGEE